jgi:hypothetical protein
MADLGDRDSYPDALLPEENVIRGQHWPADFVSDFNVSTFACLSGSMVAQQAPLSLPPAPQQLLPLWARNSVLGGLPWPVLFESDFNVGAFLAPSRSMVAQQAPLGLPPAPQQLPPPPCFQKAWNREKRRRD